MKSLEQKVRDLIKLYQGYQEWSGAQGSSGPTFNEIINDLKQILNEEDQ